ncbi:MAG TPA: amidohydrolase [Thermomicrobiales bacterium]|jgi:hypothetical protein|nr:amidohydrolase [Thermomicrobiales bacterium]
MAASRTVLYNGPIRTMDPANPRVEAVVFGAGRVMYAGDEQTARAIAGSGAEAIDLRGRTATPGLNDAHAHPKYLGQALLDIDLTLDEPAPLATLIERMRVGALERPDREWIIGQGYDDNLLHEQRHPTRHDLDAAVPDRPALMLRADYHVGVANTRALELAGFDRTTPDPDNGRLDRDEHGELTGVLRESVLNTMQAVPPPPTVDMLAEALVRAGDLYRSLGVTSIAEAGIRRPEEMLAYQRLNEQGRLPLRTYLMMIIENTLDDLAALGVRTGFGDEWVRIGPAKLFADGTIGGRTAKFREPFVGESDNTGLLMQPAEEIHADVLRAHRAGFQVAIHAIGDAAIDTVLDAYEAALLDTPRPDHRHRIEHCSIVDEATIQRIARVGAVPVPGTSFLYYFRDGYVNNLGYDRIRYAYGIKTYNHYGVMAAASTDCPVVSPDPMVGLQTMMTRLDMQGRPVHVEEAVSLDDALRAYTVAGAYASFEDQLKGQLKAGQLADAVIFDRDLGSVEPGEITQARADMTIQGGEVVYERGQN